jgi:hypothetical protein
MTYRYGETSYHIKVENPNGMNQGGKEVRLDGQPVPAGKISLVNDGHRHLIEIIL